MSCFFPASRERGLKACATKGSLVLLFSSPFFLFGPTAVAQKLFSDARTNLVVLECLSCLSSVCDSSKLADWGVHDPSICGPPPTLLRAVATIDHELGH